jgi:hypothetical protein
VDDVQPKTARFATDWLPGHIGLELRCAK